MRCPKGYVQKPAKSGNCVAKGSVGNKTETKKVTKKCPKGTRKNRKTGECVGKIVSSEETNMDKMYRIAEIHYIYPSEVEKKSYGSLNIESVLLQNNEGRQISIVFEDNIRIFFLDQTTPVSTPLRNIIDVNELKNSNVSTILFDGMGNDDDGNYSLKENTKKIKEGNYGKYVKIKVTGNYMMNLLGNLNENDKQKLLLQTIKVIQKL